MTGAAEESSGDAGTSPARAAFRLDGSPVETPIEAGESLLDLLRCRLHRIGACEPCRDGRCGACMVLMDGEPVHSCRFPAKDASGRSIVTAEGLGTWDHPHPLLRIMQEQRALQCGFCTPAMLLSSLALLRNQPDADEKAIRRCVGAHLCHCRSYGDIARAVALAKERLRPEDLKLPGE